jgi:hypothetical protein
MYADKEFGNDNIECFLVYGFTMPEGNNVYVGRKHKLEHTLELWDPINGDCYYFAKEWNTTPFLCFNFKTGLKVESGCNFFAQSKNSSHGPTVPNERSVRVHYSRKYFCQYATRHRARPNVLGFCSQKILEAIFALVRISISKRIQA